MAPSCGSLMATVVKPRLRAALHQEKASVSSRFGFADSSRAAPAHKSADTAEAVYAYAQRSFLEVLLTGVHVASCVYAAGSARYGEKKGVVVTRPIRGHT